MSKRLLTLSAMAACLVAMVVGVAAADMTPPYVENADCIQCHSAAGIAVSKVDFDATPLVNRASACKKCHWEPAAPAHPFHYATWNCGSCHFEMGTTNFSAIPKVYVPALDAYFFSASSALADKDTLHIIHSNPRWAAGVVKKGRQCGSCHAAANCTVCHEGAIDQLHEDHTWDAVLEGYWPGTGPAATVFGAGTPVGVETERTLTTGLTCSNDTCHDIASGASPPVLIEDGNAAIKYVPTWGRSSTTGYTGNTYRISNALNATAEYRFTGQKVEFISDRDMYRGKAQISIDGVVKDTVDLYAAVAEKQFVAFTSEVLASGDHTITVKVTRTKNVLSRDYYVVVDAFRVFPRMAAELTHCTVCHSPAATDFGGTNRKLDHGAPVVNHTPASSTCTTGSGCHTTYTNIANGHAAKGDTCNTCHENLVLTDVGHQPYKFKGGITKECRTCHNATLGDLGAKTGNPFLYTDPHGRKHTLTLADSNYDNASVTGCTNAGAGCHGAGQVSTDIVTYHTDQTSCYSGACHTSGSKASHNQPFTCQACHDGTFTNASNTNALAQAAPAGHYGDTTHTAVSMDSTVTGAAGGVVTAACVDCHSPVNGAGIDNLWYQHQGVPDTAPGVTFDVTCWDCHNANVNVTLEITDNWTNNTCADCHKGGVLDTAVQHGSTASVVNGTSSLGDCAQSGCHASMNLHQLHKGNGGADPACSVCHNYAAQAGRPTQKDCGVAACHPTKTLANHGVRHTLNLAASNYADGSGQGVATGCTNSGNGCHGASTSTNIADYHPASGCTAGLCHTSGGKGSHHQPFVCGDCHDSTYAGAQDTTALADLAPAGHYSSGLHTASAGLGPVSLLGGSTSETCSVCHDLSLKDAHDDILSRTQGTKVTCGECHNYNAAVSQEVTATSWTNDRCSDCHNFTDMPSNAQHTSNSGYVVTAVNSSGCSSSGRNCHDSSNLHYIHRNEAAGCDLAGCHDVAHKNIRPTVKTCGQATGCHLSATFTPGNHDGRTGIESTHTASAAQAADATFASTRCDACHGMTLNAEHVLATTYLPGTGTSCEKCHNRAGSDAAVASTWLASRTGNTTTSCATCHGIDTIPARHVDASSTAHSSPTSPGCGNTGIGCHNTNDLSQVGVTNVVNTNIHSTCLRCHDKIGAATWTTPGQGNMKWNPALDTCGGAECHTTAYYNPNVGATQYQHRIGQIDVVTGNDAGHHAADLVAAGYGGVPAGGKECNTCHRGGVLTAHGTIGPVSGGSLTCAECHNDATLGSATIAKSSWAGKKCTACHTSSVHNTYTPTNHKSSSAACANTGAGCHNSDQLDVLHAFARGGGAPKYPNTCYTAGCHDTLDKNMAVASKTCGQGSGGCHLTKTPSNHGASHTLTDSPYNNSTISGCTGAGDGCHGTTVPGSYAATQYHPTAGVDCLTSKCHDASATNHGDPAFDDPNSCQDCHGGGAVDYMNAPLVSNLLATVGASEGHYDPTLHDANGMSNTLSAGGTASATCNNCHSTSGSPLNQLYAQHQNTNATPASVGPGFSNNFASGNFTTGGWTADYQPYDPGMTTVASENFDDTVNWVPGDAPPAPWTRRGTTNSRYTATAAAYVSPTQSFSLGRTTDGTEYVGYGPWNTTGGTATLTFKARAAQAAIGVFSTATSADSFAVYTTVSPALTTSWQTYTVTVPSNAALTLRFNYIATGSQFVYFDDVALTVGGGSPANEDGWSVVSTAARAIGGDATTRVLKKTGIDNSGATSIDFSYDLGITGFEAGDSLTVQSSPDGSTWTNVGSAYTANRTLATVTGTLPVGTTAIQFVSVQNAADDLVTVDNVVVTPVGTATAGTGTSYTCGDCHNSAASGVVTSDWASDTCAECHDATLPGFAQHSSTPPVVAGTTTGGCGSASCHGTLDLHQVHKGDGVDSDGLGNPSCGQTGCHDYTIQANTPTTLACAAAGCHDSGHMAVPHYANYAAGTLSQSITYQYGTNDGCFTSDTTGCHSSDLVTEHVGRTVTGAAGNTGCGLCHGTAFGDVAGNYYSRTAIQAAITANDKRCTTCHFETSDAAGTTGVQAPHVTNELLGAALSPAGQQKSTTYEFGNFSAVGGGGGHNSMAGNAYPKTTFGTINGVVPGTINYPSSFAAGWSTASRVLCDDCHYKTAAPNGPQGASVPWYLENAVNPARPAVITHWYASTDTMPALCARCHGANGWETSSVHNNDHNNRTCDSCHIRIPHAWKRPRLLRRVIAAGASSAEPVDGLPYANAAQANSLQAYRVTAGQTNFSSGGSCRDNCGYSGDGRHTATTPYWP